MPTAQEELKLGHECVLLVDDEQRILNVGRTICKALGYTVFTADSGKKALKLYKDKKNDINIVVLDMIMPGMDGLEVFLALKNLTLISRSCFPQDMQLMKMPRKCSGRGVKDIFSSPIPLWIFHIS